MTTAGGEDYGNKKLQHCGREGQRVGSCTVRSISTTSNVTYQPQEFLASTIKRDTGTAARSDTIPTCAVMLTKFPDAAAGDYFELDIHNTSASTGATLTLVTNTGWTLIGETVIQPNTRAHLMCRFTSISSATGEVYISVGAVFSGGFSKLKVTTPAPTVAYSISAGESGTTFMLAGGATAMKLPTPASGLHYRFILSGDITGNWTVVSTSDGSTGTALIFGSGGNTAGTAGPTTGANAGTAVQTITFVSGQDSTGDSAYVVCNGTNWYVINFFSGIAAGITLS